MAESYWAEMAESAGKLLIAASVPAGGWLGRELWLRRQRKSDAVARDSSNDRKAMRELLQEIAIKADRERADAVRNEDIERKKRIKFEEQLAAANVKLTHLTAENEELREKVAELTHEVEGLRVEAHELRERLETLEARMP